MKKKIAIYIPAYNSARTITSVLDRIPDKIKKQAAEIYIVDNASTDNIYYTYLGYKREHKMDNLTYIRNKKNLGYGGSQKVGYQHAIDKGYDIVAMVHSDGQYAPEKLPELLKLFEKGHVDMAFGSRIRGNALKGGMPLWRFVGNRVLTYVENKILDMSISEFHSGYRVYNVHSLKKIPFHLCSSNYHFDTEILIQCRLKNFVIKEVPIPTYYGEGAQSPSFWQMVIYTLGIINALQEFMDHKKGNRKVKKYGG